ncbi:MAG: 3-dehydroquinate synthase, partial [Chlamydiae bacterium]|nr:3-dehydroquinate synthase [Chlamydiota bacterium]
MKICTPPTQCFDQSSSQKSIATETFLLKLDFSTQLFFGSDLTEELISFSHSRFSEIALFADSALLDLYAKPLQKKLNALLFPIPSGEKAKTKDTIESLAEELFEKRIDRNALFIALGGGATCDAVGFLASIYLRGVSLVFVPTTILAMVDAAIGGKTAIDTPFGKNLIGTFYPPKAVFVDENFLKTLPEIERLNGLAEIFKLGLVSNRSLCYEKDAFLIQKAIRGKMAIVSQDVLDKSIRRIL